MEEKHMALVTGANRGLGLEISRQLRKKGMTVLMGSRDSEKGEKEAETFRGEGFNTRAMAFDVTDSASILMAVETIQSDFGKLDMLVNNAAVLLDIGVQPSDVKEEVLRTTFEVNSVCPGWVMTDMGHDDLPDFDDTVRSLSPQEAVEKLIWLTELPDDGPTGGFFSEGRRVPW